jgi:hypothetical protein
VHGVNACAIGGDELTQRTRRKKTKKKKKKSKKKKKKKKKLRFAVTFCTRPEADVRAAKAIATKPKHSKESEKIKTGIESQCARTVCKSSNTNVSKFAFGIDKFFF